jgi:hypothetical protein
MSLFNRWPFGKGNQPETKGDKDYDSKAGVGKLDRPDPTSQPQPQNGQGIDAETERTANEARLRELGVSDKMIQLLRRHGHTIKSDVLVEKMHRLNKDLEYEGFAPIEDAEQMLRIIIAHGVLGKNRNTRAAQLEQALKNIELGSLEHNVTAKFVMELKEPLTLRDAALMLAAKKLLKAEDKDQAITDADLEQAVKHLKKQAWKRKANRLAHSQAQFLLKSTLKPNFKPHDESEEKALALTKKFGEKVPPEQAIELARHIFDEYTRKHPFQG